MCTFSLEGRGVVEGVKESIQIVLFQVPSIICWLSMTLYVDTCLYDSTATYLGSVEQFTKLLQINVLGVFSSFFFSFLFL